MVSAVQLALHKTGCPSQGVVGGLVIACFRPVRVAKSLPVEAPSSEINKTTLHDRWPRTCCAVGTDQRPRENQQRVSWSACQTAAFAFINITSAWVLFFISASFFEHRVTTSGPLSGSGRSTFIMHPPLGPMLPKSVPPGVRPNRRTNRGCPEDHGTAN